MPRRGEQKVPVIADIEYILRTHQARRQEVRWAPKVIICRFQQARRSGTWTDVPVCVVADRESQRGSTSSGTLGMWTYRRRRADRKQTLRHDRDLCAACPRRLAAHQAVDHTGPMDGIQQGTIDITIPEGLPAQSGSAC